MRWMRWPSTSTSITIGVSCPLLSSSAGKEISLSVEKLWVVFCRVIRCQGWTMKIAVAYSPRFPPCFISLIRCDNWPDLTASSICLLRWMHSSVLCPLSPWNLFLFLFSAGPVMGDGALNFTVSITRISFGVFGRVINGLWWELVEPYSGEANEHGSVQPATRAVGNIPFFLNFLLSLARACDIASNEFLASFLLWLWFLTDLLVRLCRGATSGPSHKCTLLLFSPNRVKTSLSLGPSLVNTVVFNGLLQRVGSFPSRRSLENTLAVCEERVPLDAVSGLWGNEVIVVRSTSMMLPAFVAWLPRLSLSSSVIPIKNVGVLPRSLMLCPLLFLAWSRVVACLVVVHVSRGCAKQRISCSLRPCAVTCSISTSTYFGSGCLVMFVTSGSASVCCMFSAAESVYVFLLLFVYLCSDLSAECVSASALRLPY
ncbi:hypothetical protein Tco_1515295 [Tanacetum coccineum]